MNIINITKEDIRQFYEEKKQEYMIFYILQMNNWSKFEGMVRTVHRLSFQEIVGNEKDENCQDLSSFIKVLQDFQDKYPNEKLKIGYSYNERDEVYNVDVFFKKDETDAEFNKR